MQLTPPTEWTELATRQDVATLRTELGARIENVRVGLDARIDGLESDLRATEANLRADLRATESRITGEMHRLMRIQTIWFIGALLTVAGLVLAAAQLL